MLEQGLGRDGWAHAIGRTCHALSEGGPLLEEYDSGLRSWRHASELGVVALSLFLAIFVIPTARHMLDPVFEVIGRRVLLGTGHPNKLAAEGEKAATPSKTQAAGKTRAAKAAAAKAAEAKAVAKSSDGEGEGEEELPPNRVGVMRVRKWREASWKLCSYGTLMAFGLFVCVGQPWLKDTSLCWAGWPTEHHHSLPLQFFYAMEMAHYLYGTVDQLVWESRRKDHAAMVVHHLATLALLVVSFHWSFLRVGAIILLLHDACDVWMEAAKLANYAKITWASSLLFVLFASTWFVLRMLYFPFVVIKSTSAEALALLVRFGGTELNATIWAMFNVLLLVLLALHVYWFYFILLIALRVAFTPTDATDARSDDEDEHDD